MNRRKRRGRIGAKAALGILAGVMLFAASPVWAANGANVIVSDGTNAYTYSSTGASPIAGGTNEIVLDPGTSTNMLTIDGTGTTINGGATVNGGATLNGGPNHSLSVDITFGTTITGGARITGGLKASSTTNGVPGLNVSSGGANVFGGTTTDTLNVITGSGQSLTVDGTGTTITGGTTTDTLTATSGAHLVGGGGNGLTVGATGTTVTGMAKLDSATGNTLTVNGTGTTITSAAGSTTKITGGATIDTLTTTGAVNLNGGANITGGITTDGLFTTGNVSAGALNVTGQGGANVTGDVKVGNNLDVTGAANLNGGANSGAIHINDATSGANNISGIDAIQTYTAALNGHLDVAGAANLNGGANSGAIHINDATSGANNVSGINSLTAATVNTSNIAASNISTGTLSTTGDASVGGNLDVNGNLRVTGQTGGSVLGAGTASSSLIIMNKGETGAHASISGTGAITMTSGGATADQAVTSLTLTNGLGNTHGLVVTEKETTLSGGTHSTNLALNDAGAAFQSSAGGPVKVTGVADGSSDYDAVNYRQLKKAYSGVASVAALAAIPAPAPGKRFSLGLGVGNYMSQSAMAIGFKASITDNISFAAGAGLSNEQVTSNAGIGYSW